MAIKHYCDGCDNELQPGMLYWITVRITEAGTVVEAGGEYELCKSCADNMNSMANPANWTRHQPPVMKRAM